mmetsp:Transcript_57054/g.134724  ORF Transcript_57054/g.134724 Transcript_57054/m.134724 type:complete len:405 (+) Transcript_57054:96-1310(+)
MQAGARQRQAHTSDDDVKAKKEVKAEKEAARRRAQDRKFAMFKYGPYALAGTAVVVTMIAAMSISRGSISTLDLANKEQLKSVFFGGEPWLLQCANENVTVHQAFATAAQKLTATTDIRFAALDCTGKLPSNKTFFQRFKLPPVNFSSSNPAAFLSTNGDMPIQVPTKYVSDPAKLIEWAEKYSKASVKECSWEKTFQQYCVNKEHCVMLHTKGKTKAPAWLPKLMAKHRTIKYLSINRKRHQTSFDGQVRMPRKDEIPRLAVMTRTTDKEGKHSYAVTPHRGEWTESEVKAFVTAMLKPGATHKDTLALEGTPWFDKPPADKKKGAKARAANKEHRERQRKAGSSGGSSGDEGGGKKRTQEEEASEEEKARVEAVRKAESQLTDDDDVVVSDIDEEDEDDGLV